MKFTEETLEKAVIELFEIQKIPHFNGSLIHRKEKSEVLLQEDLKQFLLEKYRDDEIIQNEITTIIRKLENYPSSVLYESNKAIMKLVADGFQFEREDRTKKDLFIHLLDYTTIENNIFKIVNQLEIQGYETRIPDAIVYVNGLPLVVLEFKTAIQENTTVQDAYTQLTVRYQRDIPELLKYNAFCVISDGVNNKAGSLFSPYEFFYAWRKVNPEDESVDGIKSLYSMVQGLFNKQRLLDVIHNFIYFPDTSKKEVKIVCRYPQYYAANKLFENIKLEMKPHGSGKGGTYFGATGCGKSYTMLYLARLLMKSTHFASPTIILITDRTDLDDQLSKQFTNAKKFIGDDKVISVETRAELKTELQGRNSGGLFLTTIHKFTESRHSAPLSLRI
jgi:type I restriction enzyme R subunit